MEIGKDNKTYATKSCKIGSSRVKKWSIGLVFQPLPNNPRRQIAEEKQKYGMYLR